MMTRKFLHTGLFLTALPGFVGPGMARRRRQLAAGHAGPRGGEPGGRSGECQGGGIFVSSQHRARHVR